MSDQAPRYPYAKMEIPRGFNVWYEGDERKEGYRENQVCFTPIHVPQVLDHIRYCREDKGYKVLDYGNIPRTEEFSEVARKLAQYKRSDAPVERVVEEKPKSEPKRKSKTARTRRPDTGNSEASEA